MKRTLLIAAAALFSQVVASNAAILLIIDISNPSMVKISATNGLSAGSSSQRLGYEGISLLDFLKPASNIPNTSVVSSMTATSNLVPTQSPALAGGIATRYTGLASYDFDSPTGAIGPGNDLGIYQNGGGATDNSQVFVTGQRAFVGESVFNLSQYVGMLPASGTTGSIISGYRPTSAGGGHGVILGQFTVIPEPSSVALGAIASSVLLLRRRRN